MLRFVLVILLCGSSLLAAAQDVANLRDGAFRRKGVTMRLQAGRATRLSAPLTLSDGSIINPSGVLVRKDGTRQQLAEGKAVNMQGVVVNFRDDMLTPKAIDQRSLAVTGSTGETRIRIPGTPAPPATVQQLELLERRVALMQQLTDRLAERSTQATAGVLKATQYDQQIKAIDAQLRP